MSSWERANAAVSRIEELYCQAEYDFWTMNPFPVEAESCPILGTGFLGRAGVLLDDTQTPVSFQYLSMQLQRARQAMVDAYMTDFGGKMALKMLQNPFTRQLISKLTPVEVVARV